jgi:hypothetical protein
MQARHLSAGLDTDFVLSRLHEENESDRVLPYDGLDAMEAGDNKGQI